MPFEPFKERLEALEHLCPTEITRSLILPAREALSQGDRIQTEALLERLEKGICKAPLDPVGAFVSIHIRDKGAQLWAEKVMGMLLRYGERRGMETAIIRLVHGEGLITDT